MLYKVKVIRDQFPIKFIKSILYEIIINNDRELKILN